MMPFGAYGALRSASGRICPWALRLIESNVATIAIA